MRIMKVVDAARSSVDSDWSTQLFRFLAGITPPHLINAAAGCMEPRSVILILILLFLLFGPDQQPLNARPRRDPEAVKERSQQLLDVLRNSTYGDLNAKEDRWLNLTGFRENEEYQWELLPVAQGL